MVRSILPLLTRVTSSRSIIERAPRELSVARCKRRHERRGRRGRLGDPFAQLARLEDLRVGAEAEQLAIRVVQGLEADDDPTVGLDALIVAQVAANVGRDANRHLDPRPPLLEGTRPLVPERRELELGRTLERVG